MIMHLVVSVWLSFFFFTPAADSPLPAATPPAVQQPQGAGYYGDEEGYWRTPDAPIPPAIRGRLFYDENADASTGSPSCDRGQRDVAVNLYRDVDHSGTYSSTIDTLVGSITTDIIGDYVFESLAAPDDYLVIFDPANPHLPANSLATTPNPLAVSLAISQTRTANLGIRIHNPLPPLSVVLSEIAWMGTTASAALEQAFPDMDPDTANDEWIELLNTTAQTIDLRGWTLRAQDGTPNIILNGFIPPFGRFLLERTADTSAPAATADQIYTGALGNTGEDLRLSDGVTLIDRVDAWYAGNNTTKQTMVRVNPNLPGTNPAAWQNGPVDGNAQNSLADNDGDTYLYSPNPRQAAQSNDCNDQNAAIHPGASELLDFVDNDCNRAIDDGLQLEALNVTAYANQIISATVPISCALPMDNALVTLLDSAQTSLDVSIYGFDRVELRDALIRAHQRGVQVRVMGDDEAYFDSNYQPHYQALESAGIPVLYDMRGANSIEHNKFAVIDGSMVWTGSMNWTNNDTTYNANNSLVIRSPHIAQAYTTEFEEMFQPLTGHNGECKQDNTTHAFNLGGTAVRSYFSPSDQVEDAILAELQAATESIHFAMFFITSNPIGDVLVSKAVTEGLSVSGVLDAVGAASPYSLRTRLCSASIPIKIENFGGKVHHKFAVIDVNGPDPRVITGSYNWTASGAESNDENTLIIHDAALALVYYQAYREMYDALSPGTICGSCSAESGPSACYDGLDNDFDGRTDQDDSDCLSNRCNVLQPLTGAVFSDENSDAVFAPPDFGLANIDVLISRRIDRACEGQTWTPVRTVASALSGYTWPLQPGVYLARADLSDPQVPPRGAVATTGWDVPITIAAGNPSQRDIGLMACPWDLNRDHTITVEDIQSVAARWNTSAGDAGYLLLADVNKNGVVDILDVTVAAQAWATACP